MLAFALFALSWTDAQVGAGPVRTEVIAPIHADSFNKGGKAKKKTVTARAKLGAKGTWKATVKGLDYGTWKFTATAWDAAGNKRASKPITAHITVK